jgi:hypothetical protein
MVKYTASALIDTGNDVPFINPIFAIKTNQTISNVPTVKVVATNGKTMLSNAACADCSYAIQGHSFKSDFRLLEVQGYDIILGTDWLYTHSPVGLDLKTRTFSITKDGQELVTLLDESQPSKHVMIGSKMCKLIRKQEIVTVVVLSNSYEKEVVVPPQKQQHPALTSLLQEYDAIFQEPQQRPPPRTVDHAITLVEGSKLVNQRPCCLTIRKMPWKN